MSEVAPVPLEHALCVYAEPVLAGRRVVVIGDATLGLGARLVDMGARLVHVYDPEPPRALRAAAEAPRAVVVRALPAGEFDVRDGAFDVALVPDLGSIPDATSLLLRLRRVLGDGGVLIARSRVGAGPDYYELYDLVSLQFAAVRMVGEVPFFGVTLAELGDTDEGPQVSVETQLVSAPAAPAAYVVVASQRGARLDPYVLVQLPTPVAGPRAAAAPVVAQALVAPPAAAPDVAAREVARLEDELARLRDRTTRLAHEVEEEKKVRQKAELDLGALRRSPELAAARERIATLEEALRGAEEVNREWQARGTALELAMQAMERERASVGARAGEEHGRRVAALETELDARAEALAELEGELARAVEAHPQEVAQYEAALRDRAQTIKALESEVLRRERLVQELVAAFEEARDEGGRVGADTSVAAAASALDHEAEELRREATLRANQLQHAGQELARQVEATRAAIAAREAAEAEVATLRGRLDTLAFEDARREGELHARAWRIAELERRVAAGASQAPGAPLPAASDDELHALRQALAQEHASRARAEQEEALAKARIEQLLQDLAAKDSPHATT